MQATQQRPANTQTPPVDTNGYGPDPAIGGYGSSVKTLGAYEPRHYTIPEMEVIAQKAASSQMFNSGGEEGSRPLTADQAFMFGLIAEALNMPYALVLLRFEIVMGKPCMKSAYVQAEYQKQGGSIEWVETTGERVEAVFISRRHPKPFKLALTLKELADRKIATRYDKQGNRWVLKRSYENNPRAMLRYRAITEAVRATDPGILMGMYTDAEAQDFEQESQEQTEAAAKAHTSLVTHLAARRESPKEAHPAPVETARALADHQAAQPVEPTPEKLKEPREPETEWGKMIMDALVSANEAIAKLAEENPGNLDLRKPLRAQQVVRGVLAALIAADDPQVVESALVNEKGKRDPKKEAVMMDFLWGDDAEELEGAVAKYIGGKITGLLDSLKPAPAAQGELAMA